MEEQPPSNPALRRLAFLRQHFTAAATTTQQTAPLLSSVVKFFTTSVGPNYQSPWQRQREQKSTGTGFAIDLSDVTTRSLPPNCPRIVLLTNNHVIRNATTVRILRHGQPGKFIGRILCASPECDLAIVAVEDPNFWTSVTPLRFAFDLHTAANGATLPELGNGVTAIGYPMGGENISVTRGVVSRIDLLDYTSLNPSGKLLVVQIDAAINPGNSGGPVTNPKQQCVGVAFAGATRGQSIGYIIPLPVLRMFVLNSFDYLTSASCVHGVNPFPRLASLGLALQTTESPSLRKHYKLTGTTDQRLGMLVLKDPPVSSPCGRGTNKIQANDIVVSIGGSSVSEDGTVEVRPGSRVSLLYSVCMRRPGEEFTIVIVRDGKEQHITIAAAPVPRLVPRMHGVDAVPSYLVVGGLVFVPLSLPWIRKAGGSNMGQSAIAALLTYAEKDLEKDGQQMIVLSTVLSHDVNFGYEKFSGEVLKTLDGVEVFNLKHLNELIQKKDVVGAYSYEHRLLSFEFDSSRRILLSREGALDAEQEILERHSIPRAFML